MTELTDALVKSNLIQKDPMALHAAQYGTVAMVGRDFFTGDEPNYEDAMAFLDKSAEHLTVNSLVVPINPHTQWTNHGFGLNTGLNKAELIALVDKYHGEILRDCYQFYGLFNKLYRDEYAIQAGITKRQLEVLKLICIGLSNNEIAAELGVTDAAISFHLKALCKKLDIDSTREIPLTALRLGFVDMA